MWSCVSIEGALGDSADPYFRHQRGARLLRKFWMIRRQIGGGEPFTDELAEFAAQNHRR